MNRKIGELIKQALIFCVLMLISHSTYAQIETSFDLFVSADNLPLNSTYHDTSNAPVGTGQSYNYTTEERIGMGYGAGAQFRFPIDKIALIVSPRFEIITEPVNIITENKNEKIETTGIVKAQSLKVYFGSSYDLSKSISITLNFGIDIIGKYHEKYTDTNGNKQKSELQHWPEHTLIHPALGVTYNTKVLNYFVQFENYRTDKYLIRMGISALLKNLIK